MAKHRELAQVMYEQATGRTGAARIWRSVVFAGAMLGTPMLAVAEQAPAKKSPPTQSRPVLRPKAETKAQESARIARERVAALEAETTEVALHHAAAKTRLDAEAKDSERAKVIVLTLKALSKYQDDLKRLHTSAVAIAKRADREVTREAEAGKPRPRTPEDDRPRGRGFVLA